MNEQLFNHIHSFFDKELHDKLAPIVNEHCVGMPAGVVSGTLAFLLASHIFSNTNAEAEVCEVCQDYGDYIHALAHAFWQQHPSLHPNADSKH